MKHKYLVELVVASTGIAQQLLEIRPPPSRRLPRSTVLTSALSGHSPLKIMYLTKYFLNCPIYAFLFISHKVILHKEDMNQKFKHEPKIFRRHSKAARREHLLPLIGPPKQKLRNFVYNTTAQVLLYH